MFFFLNVQYVKLSMGLYAKYCYNILIPSFWVENNNLKFSLQMSIQFLFLWKLYLIKIQAQFGVVFHFINFFYHDLLSYCESVMCLHVFELYLLSSKLIAVSYYGINISKIIYNFSAKRKNYFNSYTSFHMTFINLTSTIW